jgi:hypothetical protein
MALLGQHSCSLALDRSTFSDLYLDQKFLMYLGGVRKEDTVNDYLLHEMARIRMDDLREEASRGRVARRSRGWRRRLGILAGSWAYRGGAGGSSRRTVEEACCA